MTNFITKLVEMGGNEWKKGDHHRVYFNNANKLIGLSVQRYGTGNVSSAKLDGETISNSYSRKIEGEKVYFDAVAKVWVSPSGNDEVLKLISVEEEVETVIEETVEDVAPEAPEAAAAVEVLTFEYDERRSLPVQTAKALDQKLAVRGTEFHEFKHEGDEIDFGVCVFENGQAAAFFANETHVTVALLTNKQVFGDALANADFVKIRAARALGLVA